MGESREVSSTSQLDLFSWRERSWDSSQTIVDHAARPHDPMHQARTEARNVATMSREALLAELDTRIDESRGDSRELVVLIAEVERRREATAASSLVRVCRRHAGFDRSRPVPEVAAALKALTAVGAADAAPAILRLVEQGALGHVSVAEALRYFASLRYRPAAVLVGPYLNHDKADVREAACGLAATVRTYNKIERLQELCNDTSTDVIDAALIALGKLGHRPVKQVLESRLRSATIDEIPRIVDALVPVSDEETAVCLGRLAERIPDDSVRRVLVGALAELDGRPALTWLFRLAEDPSPEIRRMVAEALAERGDPRNVATLRRLTTDEEPEVRETAKVTLLASNR